MGKVNRKIELSIICIKIKRYLMFINYVTKGKHVNIEKNRAQDRTLRYTTSNTDEEMKLPSPTEKILSERKVW